MHRDRLARSVVGIDADRFGLRTSEHRRSAELLGQQRAASSRSAICPPFPPATSGGSRAAQHAKFDRQRTDVEQHDDRAPVERGEQFASRASPSPFSIASGAPIRTERASLHPAVLIAIRGRGTP
jgi:hypothetical protein